MKLKSYYIYYLLLILCMSSCNGCKRQQGADSVDGTGCDSVFIVDIQQTSFDNNWNKLDQESNILSLAEYDSLGLDKLSFIGPYGEFQYEKGEELLKSRNKKLLTIKSISSGEISEYLLGYVDNQVSDSLLVTYEDNVEYFSKVSSIIAKDTITVMAINWDYSGMKEISDTIISKYIITPELKFEEIIEE